MGNYQNSAEASADAMAMDSIPSKENTTAGTMTIPQSAPGALLDQGRAPYQQSGTSAALSARSLDVGFDDTVPTGLILPIEQYFLYFLVLCIITSRLRYIFFLF